MADASVAELLRRMRVERGHSLRTAAKDLGVDPSYLSRVESGARSVSEGFEARVSNYYGLDRDLLDLAAGRAPADIIDILRRNPDLLAELRRAYGS
jgi:transcriptional regulator with XRE-family HTH domain